MTKIKVALIFLALMFQSFAHANQQTEYQSVVEYIDGEESISVFSSLLTTGYLDKILRVDGQYTVFAFTNQAYQRLPVSIQKDINSEAYRGWRARVLTNHITDQAVIIPVVKLPTSVTTLAGNDLILSSEGDDFIINNARILNEGVTTQNGVVYIVDSIVIP